ncbi:MAG: hypothetical protein H7249_05515 [Chitinophagaceae bacterium]|nr:hypothetical protein [Oligoflexus sp.]
MNRSFILRCSLVLIITMALGLYAWKHLKIEQDVVASIEKSRPEEAAVFHKLQGSGFFQNQIFIRMNRDDPVLYQELIQKLADTGYQITRPFEPKIDNPRELYALIPFLPEPVLTRLLSDEHQEDVLKQLRSLIAAPGGIGMVKLLQNDPLLLSMDIPKLIQGKNTVSAPPVIAKRDGDIDWEKTRVLYSFIKTHDKDLSFVGGDFFALENYDAVHHDIMLCSVVSLILSLIIFRCFCRQWSLLAFLVFGTAVSSVIGLLVAEAVDGALYGLVLAFTSTFVSFNNETLVHLAGLDFGQRDKRPLIGIFSALGTTVIGFLVLLFSSSHMTRQLALLSLGSLFGFILFLLLFIDKLKALQFRPLALPQRVWNRAALASAFLSAFVLILVLPKPAYKTNLEEFRFATPYLEAQTEIFAKAVTSFSFDTMHAVPLKPEEDPAHAFFQLKKNNALASDVFHPLNWYIAKSEQDQRITALKPQFSDRLHKLQNAFQNEGIRIDWNLDGGTWVRDLDTVSYLKIWQKIWPLPWYSNEKSQYLLVFKAPEATIEGAIPMHPKAFYEFILSDLTKNLGSLFLVGLGAMLLYLVPWQKRWDKIALIFLPLLIATLGLQIFFLLTHRNITIVHVMGLALVISVALDYASILVSTDHDPRDQGKVVLTGGLTLASFGSLLCAQHPVLKELAIVVFIGTAVAFVMALFTRIPKDPERSEP